MSRTRWLIAVVALFALGGGLAVVLWPEAPAPPPAAPGDTGMTRDQTEEFMRTIGYVQ